MAENKQRIFYRRAIKVGNSAGVLLPRHLLDADVRVVIVNKPRNTKKDALALLEPVIEEIIGVYLISGNNKKTELLAVSTKINKHIEKGRYVIDVVPLKVLKKSIKDKQATRENISKAKTIINKKLLSELKKEF